MDNGTKDAKTLKSLGDTGMLSIVYFPAAVFDRSGRYVITCSDDRLVKIWSMETAYCLASFRGHEGDLTDLTVSSNNGLVASSSNDCVIRVVSPFFITICLSVLLQYESDFFVRVAIVASG